MKEIWRGADDRLGGEAVVITDAVPDACKWRADNQAGAPS